MAGKYSFFSTVLAVSCFPLLVQHTTGSYRLLVQERASGPGASFFPWLGQLCLLQELTELQSRRRDQYLQMADQYLQMADQSTSAPSLGASIKLFEVRKQESMSLHPESMPRSPGRRKVVEPTQNKKGFGAMLVASVHSIPGKHSVGGVLTTLCWDC